MQTFTKECEHCKKDLELNLENFYGNGRGGLNARLCKVCNNERSKKHHSDKRHTKDGRIDSLVYNARRRAKEKGYDFDLSREWLAYVLKKYPNCQRTGVPFIYNCKHEENWFLPSIDRIDSSKGYTEDNVQVVIWQYNMAKNTMTDRHLLEFCKKVVNNADMQ